MCVRHHASSRRDQERFREISLNASADYYHVSVLQCSVFVTRKISRDGLNVVLTPIDPLEVGSRVISRMCVFSTYT